MDSGFPQPDVDLDSEMLAGAALLAPSFSEDLSTWRMTIGKDGTIIQELNPGYKSEMKKSVCIRLRAAIDHKQMATIQSIVDDVNFRAFESEYHCDWTDQQHTSISINLGDTIKRVSVYGPHCLAQDGQSHAIGYLRLWNLMLDISPYRETIVTSLPEKEIRKRPRSVFGRWL
jgi:hypothetical protein